MQIGGTLVNAVVRIAVLAATLALVYYFIVRPVLDTTETVSGGISNNIQRTFDEVNEAFDQAGGQNAGVNRVKIKRTINQTGGRSQQRLINCIERARQDINRIQRCADRFGY
jgi:F0F1-type ATP synthase membrane subunit b/b'